MTPLIVAIAIGCLAGSAMRYVPMPAFWQTQAALAVGWLVASIAMAISWLVSPPAGVDVLAISFGLSEAALTVVVIAVLGALAHWLLTGPGAVVAPTLTAYRTLVVSLVGAALGAIGFAKGIGAVHGVTG